MVNMKVPGKRPTGVLKKGKKKKMKSHSSLNQKVNLKEKKVQVALGSWANTSNVEETVQPVKGLGAQGDQKVQPSPKTSGKIEEKKVKNHGPVLKIKSEKQKKEKLSEKSKFDSLTSKKEIDDSADSDEAANSVDINNHQFTASDNAVWTREDLLTLVNQLDNVTPDGEDEMSLRERVAKIKWKTIKFGNYTSEQCRVAWMKLQMKRRHKKNLKEMVNAVKELMKKKPDNQKPGSQKTKEEV